LQTLDVDEFFQVQILDRRQFGGVRRSEKSLQDIANVTGHRVRQRRRGAFVPSHVGPLHLQLVGSILLEAGRIGLAAGERRDE
jgi:hypothetical protein